ncbi:MAG: hypothetical protein ACNA8P_07765, partial [Phycisphaerales bacterium]
MAQSVVWVGEIGRDWASRYRRAFSDAWLGAFTAREGTTKALDQYRHQEPADATRSEGWGTVGVDDGGSGVG